MKRSEYKILFVCAGGMSTGLLMRKMEKYASEQGIVLKIDACGVGGYERRWPEYDIIMVGPQARFKIKEMKEKVKIPVEAMAPQDYGLQNCKAIFELADKMYDQKEQG